MTTISYKVIAVVALGIIVLFATVWYVAKNRIWASEPLPSISATNKTMPSSENLPTPSVTATEVESLTPTDESTIPILMYHHVKDWSDGDSDTEKGLSVPVADLDGQMKALKDAGYQTTTLSKLFFSPQDKKVILTFDDGYKDNIDNAAPILKKYGFSATLFVITSSVGSANYANWDDLKKLKNEYGWTIGAHTKTHPGLTNLGTNDAIDQIKGSKDILESNLGGKITDFSYPAGQYDDATKEIVKNAGYDDAVTTKSGSLNYKNNPYELKRLRINGNIGVGGFKGLMELP